MSSVYEKYKLKPVINASGRMTILGVSTPAQEVVAAVNTGLNHYFEIKELVRQTGSYIAKLLNTEDAVVVSCASAGIAQSIAAMITRGDRGLVESLHSAALQVPHEIVVPKGHNVNFGAPVGTMVALGGGRLVEAGYSNECSKEQLSAAISAQTAAILYIKSHHCVQKSHLTVTDAVAVAKAHNVPLIVDAAAEEDLFAYSAAGADLVIYSGAKAIEGPTSGLVIGRQRYIEWVRQQAFGIGRAMKVGKEGILGLTCAIENYLNKPKQTGAEMIEVMHSFIDQLNTLHGVTARVVWDSAGRDIARAEIHFDQLQMGMATAQLVDALQQGNPAIYFRGYKANEGIVEADVRSVDAAQLDTVFECIKSQLTGE